MLEDYIQYKTSRAAVKKRSAKIRISDCDKLVKSLEGCITGPQRREFKMFKNYN
jgi:hypothetical protein